jgi:eukaryotic-like serine/threonine-protein kinase
MKPNPQAKLMQSSDPNLNPPASSVFGRYVLSGAIARGGMATIHIARLVGAEGFTRIVAAKRLHPQYLEDREFVTMFLDEARIASKISHPNVVPVLDVVQTENEVIIVQEYARGVPLDKLFASCRETEHAMPEGIAITIAQGMLAGLQAAHDTTDDLGNPLGIVHRDVSPQNVIVGLDGIVKVLDFGIAKASSSAHVTKAGLFKGKVAYMPAEQLRGEATSRVSDVYSVGIVLWELLVNRRPFKGFEEAQVFNAVLQGSIPSILQVVKQQDVSPARWAALVALEPIVRRALALSPAQRYPSAADMLDDLQRTGLARNLRDVGAWAKSTGASFLMKRDQILAASETDWRGGGAVDAASVSSTISGVLSSAARVSNDSSQQSTSQISNVSPVAGTGVGSAVGEAPNNKTMILLLGAIVALLAGVLVALVMMRTNQPVAPVLATPAVVTGIVNMPEAPRPASEPVVTVLPSVPPPSVSAESLLKKPPQMRWPPQPPATVTAKPPSVDCSTPFYFEGSKKVFKPGCL